MRTDLILSRLAAHLYIGEYMRHTYIVKLQLVSARNAATRSGDLEWWMKGEKQHMQDVNFDIGTFCRGSIVESLGVTDFDAAPIFQRTAFVLRALATSALATFSMCVFNSIWLHAPPLPPTGFTSLSTQAATPRLPGAPSFSSSPH